MKRCAKNPWSLWWIPLSLLAACHTHTTGPTGPKEAAQKFLKVLRSGNRRSIYSWLGPETRRALDRSLSQTRGHAGPGGAIKPWELLVVDTEPPHALVRAFGTHGRQAQVTVLPDPKTLVAVSAGTKALICASMDHPITERTTQVQVWPPLGIACWIPLVARQPEARLHLVRPHRAWRVEFPADLLPDEPRSNLTGPETAAENSPSPPLDQKAPRETSGASDQ